MRSNLFDSFDEAAKAGNGSHIRRADPPDVRYHSRGQVKRP